MKTVKVTAKPKGIAHKRKKHGKDKERPRRLFRPRREAIRNGNGTH